MRYVQLADIDAAARAVMFCPQTARPKMAARLLAEATLADKYRKRLRTPHPQFGTGTLMSAAAKYPQAARLECFDGDVLDAFSDVINALTAKLTHHPL